MEVPRHVSVSSHHRSEPSYAQPTREFTVPGVQTLRAGDEGELPRLRLGGVRRVVAAGRMGAVQEEAAVDPGRAAHREGVPDVVEGDRGRRLPVDDEGTVDPARGGEVVVVERAARVV